MLVELNECNDKLIVVCCRGAVYMMPGEIDRVVVHPSSFYCSRKSTNGYCTRQTVGGQQQNGLRSGLVASSSKLMYGQMNGGTLSCNQLTFGSSSTSPVAVYHSSSATAPRHCRYFNMQVRRLPRIAKSSSSCRPKTAAAASPVAERTLARNRESRVLISAELKNKADNEMKNILVSGHKSAYSERCNCRNGGGTGHKKVTRRTGEVKRTDVAVLAKFSDRGLKLRNGRSLPDYIEVKQEKSVTGTAGQQSGGSRLDVKVKKCHVKYRSCSLSPTKLLAFARPRRSAFTKKSVSCTFIVNTLSYIP